jgi:hypothetical protein
MFIPGDRNFLVTYDGTLWAMNAVIMGNVIGSSIIGGQIVGSRIAIGLEPSNTYSTYIYNQVGAVDNWPQLVAPT